MKQLLVVTVLTTIALSQASAQERTLVGHGIESGGFGGPVVKLTQVNGEFGVLVGGRGGWIINHVFVLGGGGYGLVNDAWVRGLVPEPRLQFGYGGLELEGIVASNSLVHITVAGLVGGGAVKSNPAPAGFGGGMLSVLALAVVAILLLWSAGQMTMVQAALAIRCCFS